MMSPVQRTKEPTSFARSPSRIQAQDFKDLRAASRCATICGSPPSPCSARRRTWPSSSAAPSSQYCRTKRVELVQAGAHLRVVHAELALLRQEVVQHGLELPC